MEENTLYYLGFSHCMGIGPLTFDALVHHFETVKNAYNAPVKDLQELIGSSTGEKFVAFRNKFDPEQKLKEIQDKNITVLTREDARFPPQLKNLADIPICLYVKGDLSQFNFIQDTFFAIVGTRNTTLYGRQIAQQFAAELASTGMTIVSGMAKGIDAIAHASALGASGKTIAFLGCGVDIIYPPENEDLYNRIITGHGLVISEFPPGMTVLKGMFIARNRLVSGLSQGVLVVEGMKNSGSLITARLAAEQGKEVFAPPAPITSLQSEAPNLLIKEGAKLVTSVEDILQEYNLKLTVKKNQKIDLDLTLEEKIVYEVLQNESLTCDDIAIKCVRPIYKVLSILTSLEMNGGVQKNEEGKYEIIL